jgi:Ni/Co efflux regulator RcnB
MKKVVLSCVMMFALLASVSVMAQDSKKAAAPAKAKTETKATTTKPESKKDSKKSETKTEKKSTSSVKQ